MDHADSLTPNRFTLLDVQFYDPLTAGTSNKKVAYHLYVPVYTIKQMTYDFYAAVKTGTNSVTYNASGAEMSNEYLASLEGNLWNENIMHMDSFDTWFTTYLRYAYDKNDINSLLSSGNINWAHDKSAFLITSRDGGNAYLPDNTYMVLVDKNNGQDKVYYAKGKKFDKEQLDNDSIYDFKLELSKFQNGNTYFAPVKLSELIEDKVTATYDVNGGKPYKKCGDKDNLPNDDGVYVYVKNGQNPGLYQYVDDNSGRYDLTVTDDVYEDYYVSIYVPNPQNKETYHFYNVVDPGTLNVPSGNARAKKATINETKNYKTLIGNLFAQKTEELTLKPDEQQITESNHIINVFTKSSIYLTNVRLSAFLNYTNQNILHGLNIYLDRYNEKEKIENDIKGLDGEERIKAWYSSEPLTENTEGISANYIELTDNRITVCNLAIDKDALGGTNEDNPYTIYSRVMMTFDGNKLEEEFPKKKGNAGVNVRVTSQIAYDESTLSTSSMSGGYKKDRHMYYTESLDSASLNYNELSYRMPEADPFDEFDWIGKISENYSRLGVNGRNSDKSAMTILTSGTYNASVLSTSDVENAEFLKLKFTLCKKTDTKDVNDNITSVNYGDSLPLNNYLVDGIKFSSNEFEQILTPAPDATYVEVNIPKDKWDMRDDIFYFDIDFNVKTGEGFTEYANYRIDLQAELLNVDGSEASDHLVYTNAKVNHDILEKN